MLVNNFIKQGRYREFTVKNLRANGTKKSHRY